MTFNPKGKSFKERLEAFIKDAKDTYGTTVGITSNTRTRQQQQSMHIAHMFLYNSYSHIHRKHTEKNNQGSKVIAWSHLSRADLDWEGGVDWDDFLRDAKGNTAVKDAKGTTWKAGHEPDKQATQKAARKLLKNYGVGHDGKAMVAPGLERCGEPCKCGGHRSRHVEGLAADLTNLDKLENALKRKKAGSLESYLKQFGLHRPLKDLPKSTRELWHVEATKD